MKRLIAIPAYNEQVNIEEVLHGVSAELIRTAYDADIIVFDDRSTDQTVEIVHATKLAAIETSSARGGYWNNVQRAVMTAAERGYDQIIFMDADGQHDASNIPKIIAAMAEGANLVTVSRFGSQSNYHMDFSKRIGRTFYRALLKLLVSYSCQDPTSGNIGLDKTSIQKLAPIAHPEIFMDTTLLTWAVANRFVVREVQGLFHEAEQSTIYPNLISALRTFLNTVCTTIRVYRQVSVSRRNRTGTDVQIDFPASAIVNPITSLAQADTAIVRHQESGVSQSMPSPAASPGANRV